MKRIAYLFACMLILSFFAPMRHAYAKQPLFLVSWDAQTSAPADYEGKRFPSPDSIIRVTVELVGQNASDKGKLLDLSKKEIRWYINGQFASSGVGSKIFYVQNKSTSDIDMEVSVQNFDSETNDPNFVSHRFTIPVLMPQVSMHKTAFDTALPPAGPVWAIPLFFSSPVYDLTYDWSLNGAHIGSDRILRDVLQRAQKGGNTLHADVRDGKTLFGRASDDIQFQLP